MYLFIVNPSAGNGQAGSLWKKVEAIVKKKKIQYAVLIGGSEASARDFIWNQMKAGNVKAVAVIGGDGTLNAALQDLVHSNTAIALLPAGSGNDIARMFRLTRNPRLFVEKLLAEKPKTLDVLKVNNSFGLTVSGIGLDAYIAGRAAKAFYKKPLNKVGAGGLSYKLSALETILRYKPFKSTVTIDKEKYVSDRTWMIACGNTSLYGGGLVICPYAHPIDGVVDVTIVHSVKRSSLLFRLFPLLIKGEPVLRTGVTYKKGKNMTIQTNRPVPVMIDGEAIGMTPAAVSIHEKAIKMIMTTQ
ncbi:diacylglycerol/lipid kinase family protein [Domibacillus tundrae]|uniref:diacylglycerol/lipid kinase family protein n=1 Tax=Domibacillus tundrae TaxID=1587527 RepID=UPI000617B2E9|nr:diacylglycerol kinase family protein [Domibacillus tundrae]